jgi:signal transduction histidine kinase
MNTVPDIQTRAEQKAEHSQSYTRALQSKEIALAGAFRTVGGNLSCLLANVGILTEIAQAYSYCQSLAGHQLESRRVLDLVQRLDDLVSGVIQNTRRTGDPLGFRSCLVDLHNVLGLALRLNQILAESRSVTLIQDSAQPITFTGDRQLLLQAADVLVAHAIRRSPTHGRVTCLAEMRRDRALLHVADEGATLNEQTIARSLKPFATPAAAPNSRWHPPHLDLWFARLIAERHGGRIVAGVPIGGRGNLFTLSLPAELH